MNEVIAHRAVIGIVLWWAEGTKSRRDKRWKNAVSYPVEITNTNPAIIKAFADFLRDDLLVDESKIHVQIQIHLGDDQDELEKYWSAVTKVPLSRFNKTIVRPIGKKIGKSRGTCKIRFADKNTYKQLEALLVQVLERSESGNKEPLKILPSLEMNI